MSIKDLKKIAKLTLKLREAEKTLYRVLVATEKEKDSYSFAPNLPQDEVMEKTKNLPVLLVYINHMLNKALGFIEPAKITDLGELPIRLYIHKQAEIAKKLKSYAFDDEKAPLVDRVELLKKHLEIKNGLDVVYNANNKATQDILGEVYQTLSK